MDTKLSRLCNGIIEAGWLAAIVATPLFFNIHSSRVFEPDKLTLLRSIALLMTLAWIVKFIDQRGWRSLDWLGWRGESSIWRMPLILPVILLVVVYLLSTIFSINRSVSWAGSYQRLQGTYTTLSYIVIFGLMLATVRSREQVSRIVTVAIVTSIPVSLYAMLQHFGLDPLPWGGDVQRRVAGHMGNSIFIAAYLIMVVPLTLARIIDAFTNILNDEELSQADVVRSSIYIFALAIQLIAIFWSRSRGPFLGLAVSIYAFVLIMLVTLRNAQQVKKQFALPDAGRAVLLVLFGTLLPLFIAGTILESRTSPLITFSFFVGSVGLLIVVIFVMALARRGWSWLWLTWILLAITLAGLLGLFNVSDETAEAYLDRPVIGETLAALVSWRELPEIGRFGDLLESGAGSGRVRVLIWEGVLDLIAPHEPLAGPDGTLDPFGFLRPLVGYGPESMYVAYNRFYPPELATIEARNASPDRSHNETFDALVITGVIGLAAWQFLYLSVFYYGFRWLGVVGSARDRNVLIGLWIGGAIIGGVLITALLGLPFIGIALPFGAIGGLVVYLVYYALSSRGRGDSEPEDPFGVDRLLMIALVAAVLAHYVEIHFGIAIAATRTLFFVCIALMFIVGYYLPRMRTSIDVGSDESTPRRRRRARVPNARSRGWFAPVISAALLLGLIFSILGYNYMTFSLPSGQTFQTIEDVPSAGEIFHQTMFINASNGFVESPFIYLMIMLAWILGTLVFGSELAKRGVIGLRPSSKELGLGRLRMAGLIFTGMLVLSAISRFLAPKEPLGLNGLLGNSLLLIWAALCLWAAIRLLLERPSARLTGGTIGLIGLVISLPVVASGAIVHGIVLALASGAAVYILWDKGWNDFLLPFAVLATISLATGLLFAYFQALQIRAGFLPPPGITELTSEIERRLLEANQSIGLLSGFYVYFFGLVILTALALAQPFLGRARGWGASAALATALLVMPVAIFLISMTNIRVIQADIIYKRADPWDKQAGRTRDPNLWDNAIALYREAIDFAPTEDFYYLWLGRSYLERSTVTEDAAEQRALLGTAEDRLKEAQSINPLNTDHTANLARLNTRWAEFSEGDERKERARRAADYYESALSLSPHNAVIFNEYARMKFVLQNDCDQSLELYNQSIEVDPFYSNSYFERAEIYLACSEIQPEVTKRAYLQSALVSVREGLDREPDNPRRYLQLAEIYIRQNEADLAIEAYQDAISLTDGGLPQWQVDFTMAQWFREAEDSDRARQFGQSAMTLAPVEVRSQIEEFLTQLGDGG